MSVSSIDLSKLPPPNVVEPLSFEAILALMLADLRSPERAGSQLFTSISEADPAYKVLEVCAYRELLLRQRINEAARAVMLAYAMDGDLDQLGALLNVLRLTLSPADPEHNLPAVMESNESFRHRIQLAPQGFSVAGPEGAYIFHALGADARVLDASATSPSPGQVVLTVLSRIGDGVAPQDLLDAVAAVLGADDVRPLTDFVVVQSADIIHYQIHAKLFVLNGPDSSVVLVEANKRIAQYVADTHRLGRQPTISGIYAALHVNGVQRVELSMPIADIPVLHTQAAYCTEIVVEFGGVHE